MRVCDLKKLCLSNLSSEEKADLKKNGRPTPRLNIVQEQKGCKSRPGFTRKFDENVYNKTSWLCGCEENNAFFCFVCLIFRGDESWTKTGVCDIKHLVAKIRKHEISSRHKQNMVSFQFLGNENITSCLSKFYANGIYDHNETVKKNRLVVSKFIDIIKLCGKCNLPLRGHKEKADSVNKDIFLELVEYTRKTDSLLDKHLSASRVFEGTLEKIQNELLQCMSKVCKEHILQEIESSYFLAVMTDDTTDISTECQMTLVLRYELNGQIFERFWGFFNPGGKDAVRLSKCILQQLHLVLKNRSNKLIGQTYDGAAVMIGDLGNVNVKIKEIYKNAHFINCYTHQFNKLLEQAVSSITSVSNFFLNVNSIATFFSNSPDRRTALREVCDQGKLRSSQTGWSSNSGMIQCIFTFKDEILTCFKDIQIGFPRKFNAETTMQAAGFIKWLENDSFLFWLGFFATVMPHVDILYNQFQQIKSDPVAIPIAVENFQKAIEDIRRNLPTVEDTSSNNSAINTPKRRRLNDENLNLVAGEVCDIIIFQVKERFAFKDHLYGANLFLKKKYVEYQKLLPLDDIGRFCKAYQPYIDEEVLKTELNIFYSRSEIIDNPYISGCLNTLDFILSLGLDSAFKEITKTLRILVTIPMTTTEPERCFSKLNVIKSFLRNSMYQDRLSALGMLSIESAMLERIPDFNEKVIEKFIANKERKRDFHFKSSQDYFPKNEDRLKLWRSVLGLDSDTSLPKGSRICANHFSPDDFHYKSNGLKYLNNDAIPKADNDLWYASIESRSMQPPSSSQTNPENKNDSSDDNVVETFEIRSMHENAGDIENDLPSYVLDNTLESDIKIEDHELDMKFVPEEINISRNKPSVEVSRDSQHPIRTFFDSMTLTVMKFPPSLAVRAKMEVMKVISDLELELLTQNNEQSKV